MIGLGGEWHMSMTKTLVNRLVPSSDSGGILTHADRERLVTETWCHLILYASLDVICFRIIFPLPFPIKMSRTSLKDCSVCGKKAKKANHEVKWTVSIPMSRFWGFNLIWWPTGFIFRLFSGRGRFHSISSVLMGPLSRPCYQNFSERKL